MVNHAGVVIDAVGDDDVVGFKLAVVSTYLSKHSLCDGYMSGLVFDYHARE